VAMATHEAAAAAAAVVRQEPTMQSNAYLQVSVAVVATWTVKYAAKKHMVLGSGQASSQPQS
jgi:hypothetical protein